MSRFIKLSVVCAMMLPLFVIADENLKEASTLSGMFEKGRVSGEVRSMYVGYELKKAGENDIYATAIGGHLKYESAQLNAFSVAAAFALSHDIGFATGDGGVKQNPELSSSDGEHSLLREAYLNYNGGDFNFRAGRQMIDTPLADSDDIRMIANTFEAYVASYQLSNFSFMAGKLQKWQGYDADLDSGWVRTGEDGTWFGGVTYADDIAQANAWYYNITKLTNAVYFDLTLGYEIESDISLSAGVQYLNEREISSSATKADIYGALAEFSAYGFTFGAAYNNSRKQAESGSFSGFGGGTLFTSMDTMILDEITYDRDAEALVGTISYEIDKLKLSYAYGNFKGEADSFGDRAHIVEQNIGAEYIIIEDKLLFRAIYVEQEDRESLAKTDNDWNRLEFMVAYSF
ncbi:OprD family outer membrane porin [Sulfurimonas sp.]|uniref:OprD family outer membrane porin n=1 Tax=Sulfurimonas sp. TaxID=2022749 RepID=UPI0025FE81DC|nr:OprD family outer membrane porin [Sulfurimonas sp.]MBW6489405.1 OprD family outer membrane porin [Sulfurimonas sp.]